MASRARREEERSRRRRAGLDCSDAALDAAVGALDTSGSFSGSSYDSGSSSSCDSGSSGGSCD